MEPLDFLSDFRQLLVHELRRLEYSQSDKESVDQILVRYLNVISRIPVQQPWNVHTSTELSALTLNHQIASGLAGFIAAAEEGRDLRPWVSTRINDANYADYMFYDWGVYHFHLGDGLDSSGFIKRTNELLFAITKCFVSEMKTRLTSYFPACLLSVSSDNHGINCETEH